MNSKLIPARPLLPVLVVSAVLCAAAVTWLVGRPASSGSEAGSGSNPSSELAHSLDNEDAPAASSAVATPSREMTVPAETNSAPTELATSSEDTVATASPASVDEEPHAALAALLLQPESAERTQALLELVANWSTNAPAAAAQALRGLPSGPERDACLGQVVAVWSATDPVAALQWINDAGENADSASLLRSVAYQAWTAQDPAAAGHHALAHGADVASIQAILAGWTATQPGAAWDFYGQLPDAARREAAGSLLLSLAATDPARAMDLMTRHLNDSIQPDQWLALGRSLAQLDLDLAFTFEQMLPPGSAQDRLRTELDARLLGERPDDEFDQDFDDITDADADTDIAVRHPAIPGPIASATVPAPATLHSATPGKSSAR